MIISIILTTYNSPKPLQRVLDSLTAQTDKNFEVVIADDGSAPATREMVDTKLTQAGRPFHYYWQENQGFRAAKCRNGAVNLAKGDYLIFLDGDCVVFPDFVARHRQLAEIGYFISGKRIYLKRRFTQKVLQSTWSIHLWQRWQWFFLALGGQCNRPFEFLGSHRPKRLSQYETSWQMAQTCNLGVWRRDFDQIAGFDESYIGHGGEDADFVIRLMRLGIKRKHIASFLSVLHLYHPRNNQPADPKTPPKRPYLKELIENKDRIMPLDSLFLKR